MAQTGSIPQDLMSQTLLHFESGVPIEDLNIRREHRERLIRVHHVYWVWMGNPFLDTLAMFKALIKEAGLGADRQSALRIAQRDQRLLDFIIDHVQGSSRRKDEAKVRAAAEQAIRIGMETDNAVALTKGGKLLYEVAGLDKPEEERIDMSKMAFLPPVVTTSVRDVDETKQDVDDQEMKRIMAKYGGFVDEKERDIDRMVEVMEAKNGTAGQQYENQADDEQDRQ